MKLFLKPFLFLLVAALYTGTIYSLPAYRIEEICQKEKRKFTCIKNMNKQKYNLQKGNRIKIPVIPFEK